jgi:hypothetical protein
LSLKSRKINFNFINIIILVLLLYVSKRFIYFIENLKPISITDDNIDSAFKAIRRLQIIFQLETNILASGDIDNFVFEKLDGNINCNK